MNLNNNIFLLLNEFMNSKKKMYNFVFFIVKIDEKVILYDLRKLSNNEII